MKKVLFSVIAVLGFVFSFSYVSASVVDDVFQNLEKKYQSLSSGSQEKQRIKTKTALAVLNKKSKQKELKNLVAQLLVKVENKISSFKTVAEDPYTFDVVINGKSQTVTMDPNKITLSPNSSLVLVKAPSDIETIRTDMLALINAERAKAGASSLSLNSLLNDSAQSHAQYMAQSKDFAHTTKDGLKFDTRIKNAGYTGGNLGENIAWNQRSVVDVMQSWMDSPGHKANILNKNFKHIGIGFKDYYWVQNFGSN